MSNTISNTDDIIDSRDVIARLEELRDDRAALVENVDSAIETLNEKQTADAKMRLLVSEDALVAWDERDDGSELVTLEALDKDGESYSGDWKHGATLIRDSYFEEYAQQLADEMGITDANQTWPLTCIDWEQAARVLQMDYTQVDFDGVAYWVR